MISTIFSRDVCPEIIRTREGAILKYSANARSKITGSVMV
jgi:hypothetical protein